MEQRWKKTTSIEKEPIITQTGNLKHDSKSIYMEKNNKTKKKLRPESVYFGGGWISLIQVKKHLSFSKVWAQSLMVSSLAPWMRAVMHHVYKSENPILKPIFHKLIWFFRVLMKSL